eukprot:1687132-Rhodomonas_salina.1
MGVPGLHPIQGERGLRPSITRSRDRWMGTRVVTWSTRAFPPGGERRLGVRSHPGLGSEECQ